MITRDHVSDIVRARLPQDELVNALLTLSEQALTIETLEMFIEETRATAEGAEHLPSGVGLLDVSGTGGSGLSHFNTSTFCAFILAAGGVSVAKFGNRASRSGSGSADILEKLGFRLDVPSKQVASLLSESQVAFLFAPHYYPGLKTLAAARRAAGKSTVFNHIGPLLNPIHPEFRLMGVSNQEAFNLIPRYLERSRAHIFTNSLIVRSKIGMDELIPGSWNEVFQITQGVIADKSFTAQGNKFFAPGTDQAQLLSLEHNSALFLKLLDGPKDNQPWYDLVVLNAGAGFFAAQRVSSIDEGIERARELLESGQVKKKFDQVRRAYEKCSA
jgi:anthranilate phosphoribosyltransferase